MTDEGTHPASFRDPSGFVFLRRGDLYRQVNREYAAQYDRLMDSGLYTLLVEKGLLIPHAEPAEAPEDPDRAYKVLCPERVPFVSYPYEWCFSALKQAALATLEIQRHALAHGMVLKDASAYNIQFIGTRPVLVDTLSFEIYREGEPWVAYHQFCKHFLAPLAAMAYRDVRCALLLRSFVDGIPIGLAHGLLPRRTPVSAGLAYASASARFGAAQATCPRRRSACAERPPQPERHARTDREPAQGRR